VKPTLVALALVLASLLASGCSEPGVCDGLYLLQVQTVNEEADEMASFRAECRPLSLRAFDASDEPVPIAADWMTKVHHIELAGRGGRSFDHIVLDGKNLAYLTGE
jgi:hypothetical protein